MRKEGSVPGVPYQGVESDAQFGAGKYIRGNYTVDERQNLEINQVMGLELRG